MAHQIKEIKLLQFDVDARAEVDGDSVIVRFVGNANFPRYLACGAYYLVSIDGVTRRMVLERDPIGAWYFRLLD